MIYGHSIPDNPMQAKKRIGYLPEQPPLHMDMTAEEYLRFVMKAKHVPREEQNRQLLQAMNQTKIFSP